MTRLNLVALCGFFFFFTHSAYGADTPQEQAQNKASENKETPETKRELRRKARETEREERENQDIGGMLYRQFRTGKPSAFSNAERFHSLSLMGWDIEEDSSSYGALEFGGGSNGGFLFSLDVMGGDSFYWDWGALGLVGGLGVNGVGGSRYPYALSIPLRPFLKFTAEKVGLILYGEDRILLITDRARRAGSKQDIPTDSELSYCALVKLFGVRVGAGQTFAMGTWSTFFELGIGSSH